MENLEPIKCRHCGESPDVSVHNGLYFVCCESSLCENKFISNLYKTKRPAIKEWNDHNARRDF